MLRLDTDWFESTRAELDALWPLLAVGGLLYVDDYCTWQGARAATDEWLAARDWPDAAKDDPAHTAHRQCWHMWKERE